MAHDGSGGDHADPGDDHAFHRTPPALALAATPAAATASYARQASPTRAGSTSAPAKKWSPSDAKRTKAGPPIVGPFTP